MSQSMTINTATVAGGLRRQFLQGVGGVLLAAGLLGLAAAPALAGEPIKVVYHIADGVDQASHALGNLRNELRGEPDTKIVVVALGAGLNFLLQGAKDRNGKGKWTTDKHADVACRTAWQSRHGKGHGRTRYDEKPDHCGIRGQAEHANSLEQHERGVAQVQDDSERERRSYEEIAGNIFAHGVARRQAGHRKQSGHDEPERAENRDRDTPNRAEAAHVNLRTTHPLADVAKAAIVRVVEQVIVCVGGRRRNREAYQGAGERKESCAFRHRMYEL